MSRRVASYGVCALCGYRGAKAGMSRHLTACAPDHATKGAALTHLFRLRVEAARSPRYWLDLEIQAGARLFHLDQFLRDVWLECCGHLSAFTVGGVRYEASPGERDPFFDLFGGPHPRSMDAWIGEVVRPGLAFRYEYDFGSTTELKLKTVEARRGKIGRVPLRLLTRNEPPAWQCMACEASATEICTWCTGEAAVPFFCKTHATAHVVEVHKKDEGALLPVVNSPRMGVCGYTGPEDDRYEVLAR